MSRLYLLCGIALLSATLAACSSGRSQAGPASPKAAGTGDHPSPSAAGRTTAPRSRYPYTPADVDFMSHMISHHAQALVMAGWAPSHGASSSIRTLAGRITNGQQDEIATMQRWLRDRGLPVPEASPAGMTMGPADTSGHAAHQGHDMHQMLMPGMLTEAQMKELEQARGPEFDRLFLTYMIQHHRGAVTMVKQLFGTNGAAQDETVFKFASDVSVDQSTEIARMQRMLDALPPG